MSGQKTLAVFGAGTGLGVSLAKKFGTEGYRIALVARDAAALEDKVAELAGSGIEAKAFPADLTDIDGLPKLARAIEGHFGGIDVAVFAPVSPDVAFVPAVNLDARTMEVISRLYILSPIGVIQSILPNMLARKSGAVIVADGTSGTHTMPGLSGVGPAFAATRNWILTLREEIKDQGVYVGMMHVAALIARSSGLKIATSNGLSDDHPFPMIDPDDIAQGIWKLVTDRDQAEAVLP